MLKCQTDTMYNATVCALCSLLWISLLHGTKSLHSNRAKTDEVSQTAFNLSRFQDIKWPTLQEATLKLYSG